MFYMQIKYLTNTVYLLLLISQDPDFFCWYFRFPQHTYTYYVFASSHVWFNMDSRK